MSSHNGLTHTASESHVAVAVSGDAGDIVWLCLLYFCTAIVIACCKYDSI